MMVEGFEKGKGLLDGRRLFLVCSGSFDSFAFAGYIKKLNPVRFSNFRPNPLYEEVLDGVKRFKDSGCDTILAVGGGSAMDVAKSIKFYSKSSAEIIAMPTTAGTGSESTHFAVIYKNDVKQSLSDKTLLPEHVILEPSVILSVPEYIRKASMLDALCHAIESYWARSATDESRDVARKAICGILQSKDAYLLNEQKGNEGMLRAANLAGQAINMTTTTAAHAMSYKMTSLYGFAHGHAVALCLPEVWRVNNLEIPGITLDEFVELYACLKLDYPVSPKRKEDIEILTSSVNLERLKNNPVELNEMEIRRLYERIIHEG